MPVRALSPLLLACVVVMAKWLKIVDVETKAIVTAMRHDVVDDVGWCSAALFEAPGTDAVAGVG